MAALVRATTWVLPLALAASAAAAAGAATRFPTAGRASHLFEPGFHHRRQRPWSRTATEGGHLAFHQSNNNDNGNDQRFIRQTSNHRRISNCWWASSKGEKKANARRSRRSRSFAVGFIAAPAAKLGQGRGRQGRGRGTCSSSSSSSVYPLRSFSGGKGAGVWREGGGWTTRPGRQQPLPWGGRRGVTRGTPTSDVVVLDGGTGDTEYYSWAETDDDIEVRVSLPPGTAAKSVQLSVTKTSLTLGLKGREGPVLKGKLKGQVRAEESHWTMEEMKETGGKVLYLCLEKAVDMDALSQNSMPRDWEGVLEGEEPLNLYYAAKDKDFDVDAYVKKMGYDRDRDIGKVDKAMFSDLTAEMKDNLRTTLPKSSFTEKDDMIPVMAGPKVSPVIDKGVLGLPPPPPREREITADVAVNVNAEGTADSGETVSNGGGTVSDAEVMRDAALAAGFAPDLGGAAFADAASNDGGYSPSGFSAGADFNVPVKDGETGELTRRQREVAAGLRYTHEKMVKMGMMSDTNPDGTPAKVPDVEEMARAYDSTGFMFKDGDFTDEELSKYMDLDMGMGGIGVGGDGDVTPGGDFDLNDPATRSAFGLD